MKILAIILVIVSLIPWILLALNFAFPKEKWFCKHLGWHQAPRTQGFDGCSYYGKCPRCGENVLQDSQGNWF